MRGIAGRSRPAWGRAGQRWGALLAGAAACWALLGTAAPVRADTVVLQDGTRLEGKIVLEERAGPVTLQLPDGERRTVARARIARLEREEPASAYVRLVRYREGWSRLETAIVTLVHRETGQQVSLVGVVHIGDPAYYRELQRRLDGHDLVLFEGVGADSSADISGMQLPDAEARRRELERGAAGPAPFADEVPALDPLSRLQSFMGEVLDLSFQKDGIDYRRSWWKPADVTGEELLRLLAEQDFDALELLRQAVDQRARAELEGAVVRALQSLAESLVTGKPLRIVLKEAFGELLAVQMAELGQAGTEEGPRLDPFNAAIILGRNQVAEQKVLQALRIEDARRIALFYGAGHMPDLERRLEHHGLTRAAVEWLPAWDMRWEGRPLWERFRRERR
ncbi:MAG: hypothetical protein KatS3mg102_0489 [Planctomycetota bacterium]|nr:MAG: hypothetical protein KatS3mg102_0489 [Planctomycetota bacterium]